MCPRLVPIYVLLLIVSTVHGQCSDPSLDSCHPDDPICSAKQLAATQDDGSCYVESREVLNIDVLDVSVLDLVVHDKLTTWLLGFFFVTIISLASCLGLLVVPDTPSSSSSDSSNRLATYAHNALEGLALGSLLASAIFHLIPHAFELVGEDTDHHYLSKSLLIFLGIELFYMSERLMVLFGDWQASRKQPRPPVVITVPTIAQHANGQLGLSPVIEEPSSVPPLPVACGLECLCSHQRALYELAKKVPKKSSTSTLAWMVIFGDGLHNFIDGLSLGAALTDSHLTGFSIAMAILFEEIPHELGDFTILLSTGMSRKEAALWNFASASSCYLGLIVGLLLGDISGSSCYIFAMAGGMFLYISLFDIMLELNERFNEARKTGIRSALMVLACQNAGIIVGIVFLFFLAKIDEKSMLANFDIFQ